MTASHFHFVLGQVHRLRQADMKSLLILFFVFSLAIPSAARQADVDDCVLRHMRGAKLDFAAQLIKRACKENNGNRFTSDKQYAYNRCLLEHLVGVESLQAALDIRVACKRKHVW